MVNYAVFVRVISLRQVAKEAGIFPLVETSSCKYGFFHKNLTHLLISSLISEPRKNLRARTKNSWTEYF
jgi:hypothetical protein